VASPAKPNEHSQTGKKRQQQQQQKQITTKKTIIKTTWLIINRKINKTTNSNLNILINKCFQLAEKAHSHKNK